jgi:PEGA domain
MLCEPRLETGISTSVLAIVVFSSLLVAQTPAVDMRSLTKGQAQQAIGGWKQENKYVKIDKAAAGEVTKAITDQNVFKSPPHPTPLAETADTFIVGAYLDELRNRKYPEVASPRPSKGTKSTKMKMKLELSDVQAFSFTAYTQELGEALLREPGELSVTSKPPGASITIDGKRQGVTDRDFVVSRTKHKISVNLNPPCTDTVDVKDDLVVFSCPKVP